MPSTTACSSDWTCRPVPEVTVTPALDGPRMDAAELASFVEGALDRSVGMLFTATPREDLDEIGRFQQLKDQAWVGQVRAIVAAWNRASDAQREFAADEVALAVGAAPGTGARLVTQALSAAALPGLLEAVCAGWLTERHVAAVLRELDAVDLTVEQRHAVVLVALARYAGQTPRELGALIGRLVLTIDLAAAKARQDKATAARRVQFYPDVDGQGVLHARGPLAQIAAIKAALEQTLTTQDRQDTQDGEDQPTQDGEPSQDQDTRGGREAREFDLLVALLTGTTEPSGWHAHVVVPFHTATGGDLELADVPGFGPILPSTARDLLGDAAVLSQISVDEHGTPLAASTPTPAPTAGAGTAPTAVTAATEQPAAQDSRTTQPTEPTEHGAAAADVADVTGAGNAADANSTDADADAPGAAGPFGRVSAARVQTAPSPEAVRDYLQHAILAMGTGPKASELAEGHGVAGYRVPKRVQRFLQARDRSCVFPGCSRPAAQTDADHRTPWLPGATHPSNLQCLCRRHHRAKQAVLTVDRIQRTADSDGGYRWTTRGGWQFLRRDQGY